MSHHQQNMLCLPQALQSGEGGQRVQAHQLRMLPDLPSLQQGLFPHIPVDNTLQTSSHHLSPPVCTAPQDLGAAGKARAPHYMLLTAGRAVMAQQYRNQKAAGNCSPETSHGNCSTHSQNPQCGAQEQQELGMDLTHLHRWPEGFTCPSCFKASAKQEASQQGKKHQNSTVV